MRKSADWMTIWDDRILEIMNSEGPTSPTPLSKHEYIDIGKSGVSKRLKRMKDYGLVRELGNGVYSITPAGESYLEGELDAKSIDEESEAEGGDEDAHS